MDDTTDEQLLVDGEQVLVDGEPAAVSHLGDDDALHPWFRRFVLGVGALRIGIPILAFFTIVAPLVASISRGDAGDIYPLLLVRPSKDIVLWGGGLWRTTDGAVDPWLLFAAYAPLMIVMNWAFFFIGRAWGPALARGEGPGWLQRSISPKNFALARTLLSQRGPTIAILGRIALLPPTVMAAAAGTSDIGTWRYQVADTLGGIAAFVVTAGVGVALGETYEQGGLWLLAAGLALVAGMVMWMTRWLRTEADVEPAAIPDEPE